MQVEEEAAVLAAAMMVNVGVGLVHADPARLQPLGSYQLPMNRYSDPPVDLAAGEDAVWSRVADTLVELRPE